VIDLSGRVALVTGASRGLGKACALRLAEAGADVVVNYVTARTAAEEVAGQIAAMGRRTAVVKADVSEPDDVTAMMEFVGETFGALDVLVSNAATGGFRPLLTTTARQFEAAMRTNVAALIFLVQAALPLLERSARGAKIVALSSSGARVALPLYGVVGSTKAALESLVRHLALELGKRRVNVNVVQAGVVDTDSTRQHPNREKMFARMRSQSLVGERIVEGRDVADAVLYLASDLSDMVQGQVLVVDGGALTHV
jgi:enoyl-[acyl-carrier protein] reductase III